jgi:hypothetical protein
LPVSEEAGFIHLLNLPSIRELDEMAGDIASIEPNPVDWAGCVIFLRQDWSELLYRCSP